MNLRPWEYFIAVAEELHFGKAAQRLQMAQPPLSRQIQQLESDLGVKLLDRTNRKVRLTPAGEVFLQQARHVLEEATRTVGLTQKIARGDAGLLRLGFISSAAHHVLPQMLRTYRSRYPDVQLALSVNTSMEQIALLERAQLDVGLVRSVGIPPHFQRQVIREERLSVILPPGHALSKPGRVAVSDLADVPLIVYPRADNPAIYDQIMSHCRLAGFEPKIVQEANETVIAGLVSAGLGAALVIGTDYPLPPGGPTIHTVTSSGPTWDLVLVWQKDAPTIANLVEMLRHESVG